MANIKEKKILIDFIKETTTKLSDICETLNSDRRTILIKDSDQDDDDDDDDDDKDRDKEDIDNNIVNNIDKNIKELDKLQIQTAKIIQEIFDFCDKASEEFLNFKSSIKLNYEDEILRKFNDVKVKRKKNLTTGTTITSKTPATTSITTTSTSTIKPSVITVNSSPINNINNDINNHDSDGNIDENKDDINDETKPKLLKLVPIEKLLNPNLRTPLFSNNAMPKKHPPITNSNNRLNTTQTITIDDSEDDVDDLDNSIPKSTLTRLPIIQNNNQNTININNNINNKSTDKMRNVIKSVIPLSKTKSTINSKKYVKITKAYVRIAKLEKNLLLILKRNKLARAVNEKQIVIAEIEHKKPSSHQSNHSKSSTSHSKSSSSHSKSSSSHSKSSLSLTKSSSSHSKRISSSSHNKTSSSQSDEKHSSSHSKTSSSSSHNKNSATALSTIKSSKGNNKKKYDSDDSDNKNNDNETEDNKRRKSVTDNHLIDDANDGNLDCEDNTVSSVMNDKETTNKKVDSESSDNMNKRGRKPSTSLSSHSSASSSRRQSLTTGAVNDHGESDSVQSKTKQSNVFTSDISSDRSASNDEIEKHNVVGGDINSGSDDDNVGENALHSHVEEDEDNNVESKLDETGDEEDFTLVSNERSKITENDSDECDEIDKNSSDNQQNNEDNDDDDKDDDDDDKDDDDDDNHDNEDHDNEDHDNEDHDNEDNDNEDHDNEDHDNDNDNESSDNFQLTRKKPNKSDSNVNSDNVDSASNKSSDDFTPVKRKTRKRVKRASTDGGSDSDGKTKKKVKRRRIKAAADDDDDNSSDDNEDSAKKKGRKNIRKVIKTKDLEDETKRAARQEQERKKRVEERQKLFNEMYDEKPEEIKELDKLVLDVDDTTKEELISVDRKLVKKLKPHQANGVKFMWNACFESLEQIKNNPGSGCILAHCMGLGKTLQVITLVHTLLTNSEITKVEKVLIICPLSTVLNWVNEFKMWLRFCAENKDIDIYELSKLRINERAYTIKYWHDYGGVLIMGYDMFRNLSSETGKFKKKAKEQYQQGLVDPGPDLVVCDEGHLLKNSKTSLSKAVNRMKTLRRIVLTGTPLQNNLNEYYCMVQFVKPNLLGKYNEYLNRFVNPITNGQYVDSTPRDIQMMKNRSHILHKLLDGAVQRRDYSVLAPFLPVKHEYVVYIKLTELQVKLYKFYIENRSNRPEENKPNRSSILFTDFQNCQRIWTHPRVLRFNSDRYETALQKKLENAMSDDSEGSLKNFIDDSDSETSSTASSSDSVDSDGSKSSERSIHSNKGKKKNGKSNAKAAGASTSSRSTRRTRANADNFDKNNFVTLEDFKKPPKEENPTEWWMPMCNESDLDNLLHSGKLMLLLSLLEECDNIGDKLLVFSQSLFSLDVIEYFLSLIDANTQNRNDKVNVGGYSGSWSLGLDYFRLDGSTNIEQRNNNCKEFNRESNTRARLFLISTRAGGLGINLVAANRVVIFDVSWNPSHDIQSIFRVYRFGQKKPCYVYRFIALGTMEEKIYERQVTKLAISKRVIDEHQIDRHYKENDLMELYKTDLEPEEPRATPILPKDRLFASQLQKFDKIIYKYHEHDSLLENKSEETLNDDEIKAAWEEFEAEKTRPPPTYYSGQVRMPGMGPVTSNNIYGFRSDVLLKLLAIKAKKDNPTASLDEINRTIPQILDELGSSLRSGDYKLFQYLHYLRETELGGGHNPYIQYLQQQQHQQQQQQQFMQNANIQYGTGGVGVSGSNMAMNTLINPYALNRNYAGVAHNQMQQQDLIAQAQNRLITQGNITTDDTIIELD